MLEHYFTPKTVDRVRQSWISAELERYVAWLEANLYPLAGVRDRVPTIIQFGEFARALGVRSVDALPAFVDRFLAERSGFDRRAHAARWHPLRARIEQFLAVNVPGFQPTAYRPEKRWPFSAGAPGFEEFLRSERGLREATIVEYSVYLRKLEAFLKKRRVAGLKRLTSALVREFIVEVADGLSQSSVSGCCGVVSVFVRYLHRQRIISSDLSQALDRPRTYALASLPRSIAWAEVAKLLAHVDRRTIIGRRDYAMLMLLISYGLRANEVAAIKLDDIDWQRGQLRIPFRKADHRARFPLSATVGNAIVDYLRRGRPASDERHLFLRTSAPYSPCTNASVAQRTATLLKKAGISVPKPGSHTLRHTCVQRLVDADFPLKVIGDYVGHRAPASTQIYGKIALRSLRDIALGADGALP